MSNIKIRYLNYYNYWGDKIDITLNYPENIISISLSWVSITNLNHCVNLHNIYS